VTRPNRVLVEGGVCHAYNRLGRGERVFDQETQAAVFVVLLRDVGVRDGLWKVANACSSGTEADGGHGFSTATHHAGPRDGWRQGTTPGPNNEIERLAPFAAAAGRPAAIVPPEVTA
jgi:hypothetical protein